MRLEVEHAEHRREAGGADRHRALRREAGGHRHQPVGLDARLLRIAAPMQLADAPARQDHLVAGLVARGLRGTDRAGEIDARHVRIFPHEAAQAVEDQPVLVIEG
jgi:hypothetical protein